MSASKMNYTQAEQLFCNRVSSRKYIFSYTNKLPNVNLFYHYDRNIIIVIDKVNINIAILRGILKCQKRLLMKSRFYQPSTANRMNSSFSKSLVSFNCWLSLTHIKTYNGSSKSYYSYCV